MKFFRRRLNASYTSLNVLILIILSSVWLYAQDEVYDYRSDASGTDNNWTTVDNWEVCTVAGNPGTWVAASEYPGASSNINHVTITNSRSITLDTDLTTNPL